MKKRLSHFLLLFFYITLIIMSLFFIFSVNANVRLINSFPIYITQNRAFSFQLRDNLTTYLTLNATNNAFNVTANSLIMRNNEGMFYFTPETNSTIRLTHNMDYVTIEGQNHTIEKTQIGYNGYYGMYENEQVILIFKIKGYDISGVVFRIAMFIVCVGGLILTPPVSDIVTMRKEDKKLEQMFIWVCGWVLFGILFLVWIYS